MISIHKSSFVTSLPFLCPSFRVPLFVFTDIFKVENCDKFTILYFDSIYDGDILLLHLELFLCTQCVKKTKNKTKQNQTKQTNKQTNLVPTNISMAMNKIICHGRMRQKQGSPPLFPLSISIMFFYSLKKSLHETRPEINKFQRLSTFHTMHGRTFLMSVMMDGREVQNR